MLVRLPVAVCLFGSFAVSSVYAASASPKHGDVPLPECAVIFERFGHIRLPADAKAVSHVLKDSRWTSHAVVFQQTVLAGWIPIEHILGPPGAVYGIELSPSVSQKNVGYRIYLHATRAFIGDGAMELRAFLADSGPRDVQIDEYALCYPDTRILHVDLKSRRLTPPLF